ncbi:hypothetical protein BHE74_00034997 [Ensete ventricosum]|nr:hypothetical protein BHE74_00034997 [Ensete ventricosum]
MLQCHRGYNFLIADICQKMAAKRSKLEGNSDGGGRRGKQQRWLRLQCDFVAAGGVGCSKGAAAIGGRQGSDVHDYCRGGQQWYNARDGCYCKHIAAKVRCWKLFTARIAVSYDQGGWQQEVTVGSIGQRKMRFVVEGTREIGWLKGWWTEGFSFLVRFVVVLGTI